MRCQGNEQQTRAGHAIVNRTSAGISGFWSKVHGIEKKWDHTLRCTSRFIGAQVIFRNLGSRRQEPITRQAL
jgi:hypothetical protein